MKQQKKILYVINCLNFGGAQTQLLRLIDHLKPEYSCEVLSLSGSSDLDAVLIKKGISVHHLQIKGALVLPQNLFSIFRFAFYARKQNLSFIHAWLFHANFVATIISFFIPGATLIVSNHGWYFWHRWYHFLFSQMIYRKAKKIILNTKALMADLPKIQGILKKACVISNGIDCQLIPTDVLVCDAIRKYRNESKIVIGSAGRFVKEKRYDLFVEMVKLLVSEFSHLRFVLVGDGPERDRLQKKAQELSVQSSIDFIKPVSNIYSVLYGFDIFVLTSSYEGLPNVVMEAMCARLPIVATEVGGIPELVKHNENGFLSEIENVQDLYRGVKKLVQEEGLRKQFSQNSFERIKTFSTERMASSVQKIYQELICK